LASENALKAVYRHYGHTFRYTHDLDELVTGLKLKGVQIPANIEEATSLSSFAWEARYQAYTSRFQKKSLERLFGWPEMLLSGVKKN
jgi:HEPN domain-containing protein